MPRAIWKGTMGFGLVTIGVELLTAEQAESLDLDMLDQRDNANIGYQKINKSTGEVVPQSEIVKGFEVSDGKYVVLTKDDLKSANPKATQTVDIVAFVPQAEIPLVFYAKPYYVSPLKGSEKAYGLLRDAMSAAGNVGLAQIVIHTRQHLAAVYPYDDSIVVQLLRYAQDLKEPDDAGVKHVAHASKNARTPEIKMAKQLIESMVTSWKPDDFSDSYKDDVLKMINARAKKSARTSPASKTSAPSETKVLDLVAALEKSLKKSGSTTTQSSKTKKRTASKSTKSAKRSTAKSDSKSSSKKSKSA